MSQQLSNNREFRENSMKAGSGLWFLLLWVLLPITFASQAADLERLTISGHLDKRIARQQAQVTQARTPGGAPDYEWWYGCSPTAAGMLMGYYDINGYGGQTYRNLVPGAVAEISTFPSTEGSWEYNVQRIIASPRHASDFYRAGYLASGDDVLGAPTGPLDSLADFMGTSQDAYGNANGATTFWYFKDGSRLTVADLYNTGEPGIYGNSLAYGIYEFLRWAGYGDSNPQAVDYIYNQPVDILGLPYGFSLADYLAEVNAGRVVLIHIEDHTMLGYGYDSTTGELLIHDTANPGERRMYWGSYYGYRLLAVTVVDLSDVPGDPKVSHPVISPIIQLLLSD
jgi:hypothetical protein